MKAIRPREPARATNRAIVMTEEKRSGDSAGPPRQPGAELVFVYGTLKRGQPNHGQLAGCAFCGEARMAGLALYNLGPFPMAVATSHPGAPLQGELYAVSTAQLAALDRFEGVPRLYERQRHQLGDGRSAWVYVGRAHQVRHSPQLTTGQW